MVLGLEGWGTEGATAGGGSIVAGVFAGTRSPGRNLRKGAAFLITVGAGVHAVLYDRIGDKDGFGLFSPYAEFLMGVEVVPGVRLLWDNRAVYRWHWTMESHGQIQSGFTLALNSFLWDGP